VTGVTVLLLGVRNNDRTEHATAGGKMPFTAKSAAPVTAWPAARHWTFDRAALGGLTAFVAPPGYLLSEGLFEALARQGRPVTWVRLGPEDHDPATFVRSLVAAVQRRHPGLGRDLAAAPAGPGPAGGADRSARLAAALAAALPAPASLVVEHAHHLAGPSGAGGPAVALLGRLLGGLLDDDRACIVTSERALPAGALPARGATVGPDDLRLGPGAATALLGREAPRLPPAAARRVATLCRGAAADLLAVCGAAAALGPARVERAVDRAGQVEDLLARLAADWLDGTGPDGQRALRLALEVGYSHPALSAAVLGAAAAPATGPWLQPLADGWSAVRTGWREPLRAALAPTRPLGRETVHRAADFLVERGAAEHAVPLYLELEDQACAAEAARPAPADLGPARPRVPAPPEGPLLSVHLLGQLKVRLDEVAVDDWPSGRGRSLFKYLVAHRDPWPRREMLMEAFWPEAAPAAARNSLNVAVHGLRRAFRANVEVPVVVLEGGAYRLDHGLRLWLDVDEFERHAAAGRRLEAAGDPAAVAEYEQAAALYQGDFLADDPYEDWPVLTREQLLLTYLDVLDRLSGCYLGRHEYGACVALCRQLVQRDPCREDAHRRLMRCYARQGQPHLALRQYQACADALQRELGLDPDPATAAVARQVRLHQPV
jgi:DNA-binding SARP family transcriptional activator